jgi:hypothetical protein
MYSKNYITLLLYNKNIIIFSVCQIKIKIFFHTSFDPNQKKNYSLRDVRLIIDTAKMFYYAEKTLEENNFPIVLTKKHFKQALKQLQTESEMLQKNMTDTFYKQLQPWGLILSVIVNISLLLKTSTEFYDKIIYFC